MRSSWKLGKPFAVCSNEAETLEVQMNKGKEVKMGSAKKWKTKSKKTTQGDRVVSSRRKTKDTKKLITIGELIKHTRKKQNKLAGDIAKECNVTAECVFQWERRTYIIDKRLPQLAKALGISLERLKIANENGKGIAAEL